MKNTTDAIVLGGGIVGLFSSLYLQSKGKKVTLIEGSPSLGGLLRSFRNSNSLTYDMGTHFINKTGVQEIDELLLDDSIQQHLHLIKEQRTSSITNGNVHTGSPFPNLNLFDDQLLTEVKNEIIDFKNKELGSKDYANLSEEFKDMFGTSAEKHLFSPLYRKRFGVKDATELAPSIGVIFGHRRVIAFEEAKTQELKQSPSLDHRISHHGTESYSRKSDFFYPKSGGVQTWIDLLEQKFLKNGGEVIKETFVSQISSDGVGHYLCKLSNSHEIQTSSLISTIPPFLLAKALNFNFTTHSAPPRWTSTSIINLELDQNYLSDSHYIVNHDPEIDFFRATLYENFNPRDSQTSRITVEVIAPETTEDNQIIKKTLQELKKAKVIPDSTQIVSSKVVALEKGFPVFTSQMIQTSRKLCQSIEKEFSNISILGRHNSGKWLMGDNLIIASERLKSI